MKAIIIILILILFPEIVASQEDDWNTYINKSYKLKLSYPSICNYIEETSDYKRYRTDGLRKGLINVWQWRNRLLLINFENSYGATIKSLMSIVIIDNQDKHTLEVAAEKMLLRISELYSDHATYEIVYDSLTIDNVPALRVLAKVNQNDNPNNALVKLADFILCSNNDLIYEISTSPPINLDKVINSIEWIKFDH